MTCSDLKTQKLFYNRVFLRELFNIFSIYLNCRNNTERRVLFHFHKNKKQSKLKKIRLKNDNNELIYKYKNFRIEMIKKRNKNNF